jgi:hypothetical protein
MWDEYDPEIVDRELHTASVYGLNCVTAYLHYFVYLKKPKMFLNEIEDFLARANAEGIKVNFVFFDDCWNDPSPDILKPNYVYPAPLPGVHNSRWLRGPGRDALDHLAEQQEKLKAYVQDVVNAHKNDARVAFWQIYNEPQAKTPHILELMKEAEEWVHETGTAIPETATGHEFAGDPYSDFSSWHDYDPGYRPGGQPVYSLCTECMDRMGQGVPGLVEHFGGKIGFIFWEFGIGRDNCRFAWDYNARNPSPVEAPVPLHGMVYPDGHPWSVEDVRALVGEDRFQNLPVFHVQYFRDEGAKQWVKSSITPMIDFDLPDEAGVGSPDASAGMPRTHFAIVWDGTIQSPGTGNITFSVRGDGTIRVSLDKKMVVQKDGPGEASGTVALTHGQRHQIHVEYVHGLGAAGVHLSWSGPSFAKQRVLAIGDQLPSADH